MFSLRSGVFETNSSSTHVYVVPEATGTHTSETHVNEVKKLVTFADESGDVAIFPVRLSTLSFGNYYSQSGTDDVEEDSSVESVAVKNIGLLVNYISDKVYSASVKIPKDKVVSVSKEKIFDINKDNKYIRAGLTYYFAITESEEFRYLGLDDIPLSLPSLLGAYINHHIKRLYGFSAAFPVFKKEDEFVPYNVLSTCKKSYPYGEDYDIYCSNDIQYNFYNYLPINKMLTNILLGLIPIHYEDG